MSLREDQTHLCSMSLCRAGSLGGKGTSWLSGWARPSKPSSSTSPPGDEETKAQKGAMTHPRPQRTRGRTGPRPWFPLFSGSPSSSIVPALGSIACTSRQTCGMDRWVVTQHLCPRFLEAESLGGWRGLAARFLYAQPVLSSWTSPGGRLPRLPAGDPGGIPA